MPGSFPVWQHDELASCFMVAGFQVVSVEFLQRAIATSSDDLIQTLCKFEAENTRQKELSGDL